MSRLRPWAPLTFELRDYNTRLACTRSRGRGACRVRIAARAAPFRRKSSWRFGKQVGHLTRTLLRSRMVRA